jgi:bisphosphoglycerate-dependent phosphoglycerate mutase
VQHQQGLTTFLQNSQHTFETTIQNIIKRETGNNEGSTLNDLLTRETTSAVEQMVKIREDLKTTIDTHFLAKEKELTERMNALASTQQNERHDGRTRTLNNMHDRPDQPEHDANNLNYNPRTYTTPIQSATNETPLEEEERKLPWNHTARTMRTSIQVMSNIHRFKREVIQHNLTADPRQDQLENFYNTLVTSLESYVMPITRLTNLQPRGTTLPPKPTIDAPALDTVTHLKRNLHAFCHSCTQISM